LREEKEGEGCCGEVDEEKKVGGELERGVWPGGWGPVGSGRGGQRGGRWVGSFLSPGNRTGAET